MKLVITLFVLLMFLGFLEYFFHKRNLKKIKIRILVNGTRGKTTVTRLIAAALNEAGIKTLAKTTGSEASWIYPDGNEEAVNRKRGLNLAREQIVLFKKAVSRNAQAVVCECMAIKAENQKIMGDKLVCPTLCIITNARVDHVDEMGTTQEDTALTLLESLGKCNSFITADPYLLEMPLAQGITVQKAELPDSKLVEQFPYAMFTDNLAVALKTAKEVGVEEAVAIRGMLKAKPDIGMTGPFTVDNKLIINGFASNDSESARKLFKDLTTDQVTVLYNNRSDREFRLEMFSKVFIDEEVKQLLVIGDNAKKCVRFFEKRMPNCSVQAVTPDELLSKASSILVCMGNIKGQGKEFIEKQGVL